MSTCSHREVTLRLARLIVEDGWAVAMAGEQNLQQSRFTTGGLACPRPATGRRHTPVKQRPRTVQLIEGLTVVALGSTTGQVWRFTKGRKRSTQAA